MRNPLLRIANRWLRVTHHAPRTTPRRLHALAAPKSDAGGFTLIELLVVISIMGLLAAIAMPAFNKLKPNVMAAATQKLLTDVGRARQLAISQHTTVFMVFVWPGYWNDSSYAALPAGSTYQVEAQKLVDKQMVGYNFVSLRSVGDQPGRNTVRYLDTWRTLPEGAFIPYYKFFAAPAPGYIFYSNTVSGPVPAWFSPVATFNTTKAIPFPSETAPADTSGQWVQMPYVAFNYLGQLVYANGQPTGTNVFIPLAQGAVSVARNLDKSVAAPVPAVTPAATGTENPLGNTTNAFNVINIDWLTGRARVERQELQ